MADVSLTAATERHRLDLFPWHVAVAVALICLIGIWNLASASRTAHAPVWVTQAWIMGAGAVLRCWSRSSTTAPTSGPPGSSTAWCWSCWWWSSSRDGW